MLISLLLLACKDKASDTAEAALPRSNVPPAVVSLRVEPDVARAEDELVAIYDVLDLDDDPVDVWFEWSAGGVVIYDEGDTLPPGTALGGQTVTVELTLADGYAFGDPMQATALLENSPPQVNAVSVTPGAPTAADEVTCTYDASDADGDPIRAHYQWYVNGVNQGSRSETLSDAYVRGDQIACEVFVSDTASESSAVRSADVTVQNTPPGPPEIQLNPDPASPCTPGGVTVTSESFDLDGDAVSYEATWLDASGAVWHVGAEYPGGTFEDGQDYRVIVTPNDGANDGEAAVAEFRARGGGDVLGDGLDQDCDGDVDEWLTGAWQAGTIYWEDSDGAQMGSVMGAGDLDGDGLDEVLSYRVGEGDLLIFHGSSLSDGVPRRRAADVIIEDAPNVQDLAAADTNGDGASELLIGATGYDGGGTNAGAALLLPGTVVSGVDMDTQDSWRVEGDTSSLGLGAAVALGDLDGDGLADAVVGEPTEDAPSREAGAVYVFYSPSGVDTLETADVRLEGTNREALFGSAVTLIEDINGDGYPELAVGAPADDAGASEGGRVAIWFGGSVVSGAVDDADVSLVGDDNGDYAGREDVGSGDIDGDGRAEVVVGSEDDVSGLSSPGTLSILWGSEIGAGGTYSLASAFAVVEEDSSNAFLGLYGGGPKLSDLGGDGAAELMAGASGTGMLYVWDGDALAVGGSFGPADASIALEAESGGDQFGRWAVPADTDGDGEGEIVSSAYRSGALGSTAGAMYVFRPGYGEVEYWEPDCDAADGMLFCRTAKTWDAAREHCRVLGGDLARLQVAKVGDAAGVGAEDRSLPGSTRGRWWIGLSDASSEGVWTWLDDKTEATGWNGWASGEPRSGTDRNCAMLNGAGVGLWQANNCAEELPYVCDM